MKPLNRVDNVTPSQFIEDINNELERNNEKEKQKPQDERVDTQLVQFKNSKKENQQLNNNDIGFGFKNSTF